MSIPQRKADHKKLLGAFKGWGLSWKGLINNQKGEWWLIIQILLILAHISAPYPSPVLLGVEWPLIFKILGIVILSAGIVLAFKALNSLGESLSPLPEPKSDAEFIVDGAYKYCRHPLYQSLIIASFGVMLYSGSLLHVVLFIGLCVVLKSKAKREEVKLKLIHEGYEAYINKTTAIIPGFSPLDWKE